MKHFLSALVFLCCPCAIVAQEAPPNPAVFLLDEPAGKPHRAFDHDLWDRAGAEAKGALLDTVFSSEPDAFEKARIAATKDGAEPNIVLLSTINAPERNSKDFRTSVAQVESVLGYNDDPTQWPRKIDLPLCKLYQQRPNEGDTVPVSILLVLDNPNARLACYQMVMTYYTGNPGPDGELVEPIYVDQRAVVAQSTMPPITVNTAYLALQDSRDQDGIYEQRQSNVYAPNEEIFLRAYLTNVGRKLAGTKGATYQIDLSLELRGADDGVLSSTPLHSYKGKSTLIFPMDETYFYNDITAGISLQDPGGYIIAFLFKDASRPESRPAEVAFPIVIE